MDTIRKFDKIDRADAGIAGGKGASLGEMAQAGIPVPPGFVILANQFEQFIGETGLAAKINSIISKVDYDEDGSVQAASEKIKKLILSREIPQTVALAIIKSFINLHAEFVAVRSSATAEDGAEHAWAGQLETYLNITESDLLAKVKCCWASLFTPRAIVYRFRKKLLKTRISVAVIVQKMIDSVVSGIAFSVHPVTQNPGQMIIEAGFGLGEAIVSGAITPDSYIVGKKPLKIADINISEKNKGLYKNSAGKNEWRAIGKPKASSQALANEQILELSKIVISIENHYGFPCDIEWAYAEEKFYIVQCRPITTLTKK
jgi:pyruvate,water dikinase